MDVICELGCNLVHVKQVHTTVQCILTVFRTRRVYTSDALKHLYRRLLCDKTILNTLTSNKAWRLARMG
jgi:hypothetical protein